MENFIIFLDWMSSSFLHFLLVIVLFALLIALVREMKGIFVYVEIHNGIKDEDIDKEELINE